MITYYRNKIANYVVNKKLKSRSLSSRSFTNFLKKCSNLLIVMPESEDDFQKSKQVLKFLKEKNKRITTLNFDFRVTDIQQEHLQDSIPYGLVDYSKINLPSKKLAEQLTQKNFDAVIDLNRGENLFCSFAANLVNSSLIIGFKKKNSDKYYNLQIDDNEDNSEISYKNFINCLQMF
jgi:Family of unknown function (DUF6913)